MGSFTQALADFAVSKLCVPDAAATVIRLSALDWLAVGRAGSDEDVSRVIRDYAREAGGAEHASIFGAQRPVPDRLAALANGTISHALDYDDTHFGHIGHPSVAIFPVAMALAERHDLSMDEMLDAALVGAEVSIRVGQWLGRSHYQAGFHQTATAGTFGAAVTAGRLLGLTARQMAQVIGLAATSASGLKAQFGTMGKPFNAGQAAASGLEVARLVAQGFDSDPNALEGPFGYGATHHGEADQAEATDGMGDLWQFEDVQHKFHACCHGLHAALEAAARLDLTAPDITRIEVRTHPRWMSVCNQAAPSTGLGAKFSYTTVIAMKAAGLDTGTPGSFSDALCARADIGAVRSRVVVTEDPLLGELEAHVTLTRAGGAVEHATHDLNAALPLSARITEVRKKARALLGEETERTAWSLLHGTGGVGDIAALMRQPV
ncbi:MmgE/PrpD family protein [Thalassococcus sp. S3]|uniref:MmgE/PrpD family protein n=1 Tax=Thalassococcus sp. S3 TaxID=2017482 RepID=UPI00102444B2|nr:MmgE/PrpD family protein [Thalassococcus sp. S3]QBF31731.1 2-methylcitrate dehydratase [Thalassococcus sp. S3]